MDGDEESLRKAAAEFAALPLDALTYTLEDCLAGAASIDTLRDYLRFAADCLRDSKPLPENLSTYLQKSLRGIAEGGDANKELRLMIGHRRPEDRVKTVATAFAVWDLIHRQNVSTIDAINLIAANKCKSFESVRATYYRYKEELDKDLS